jgi:hypothetical protein
MEVIVVNVVETKSPVTAPRYLPAAQVHALDAR